MGLVAVRFDEKTEAMIKEEAGKMKMNVSDFIRYKLNLKDSSVEILSFVREFQQQRVEILEMRKESVKSTRSNDRRNETSRS